MKNRTEHSRSNAVAAIANFIILLPTQFVLRYFIAKNFGSSYMGLSGLFSSILSFLNLADLGIGVSISYALYQPLSDKNINLISSLMRLYKKIYVSIAFLIFFLGICLLPFLTYFTNGKYVGVGNIYIIFILMLASSASTYLFAYNQSLLVADQRNDVVLWTSAIANSIILIVEVVIIHIQHSIYGYLSATILLSLLYNFLLSIFVNKRYEFTSNYDPISPKIKLELIHNTIGNSLSRISGVVVTGSDNILISMFVGLSAVGQYANYSIVISVLQRFLSQLFNSIQGSIGNFGVNRNGEQGERLFFELQFINYWIVSIISTGILFCINPLILTRIIHTRFNIGIPHNFGP
ncbi:lipopolysaccharide biosynthesis protein, partial [Loigolactobacillus bifermentans]